MSDRKMEVVQGGGLEFLTDDIFLKVAVRRCAQLEEELREARHQEVARYRTLRADVRRIHQILRRRLRAAPDPSEDAELVEQVKALLRQHDQDDRDKWGSMARAVLRLLSGREGDAGPEDW